MNVRTCTLRPTRAASVAGRKVQRDVEWLTPAAPEAVIVPFEFDRLRTALLRDEGLSLKLKWEDTETNTELSLQPQNLLAALHGSIRLLGWTPRPTAWIR